MTDDLFLRDVVLDDLPIFFRRQRDPVSDEVAARAATEPAGRDAFAAHWDRIQADPGIIIKTIVFRDRVAGSIMSYQESGRTEVSYWLGTEYWGKGLATRALQVFLARVNPERPIYARAASDNAGSLRVLQKCGFAICVQDQDLAAARDREDQEEFEELVLVLG